MPESHEDQLISHYLQAIGPWRDYIVIGGGFALFIYKLYLANSSSNNPVGTRDIDSLIPRRVPRTSFKNIALHLKEAGFSPFFKDLQVPATESYVKEINGHEVEVEFLTDTRARKDNWKNVAVGGVVAQPLSYLSLSLSCTQAFTTLSQETGRVVSPAAWIFHKGLTFPKRKSASKALKDLYGIWYVASQLEDFSDRSLEEFSCLARQHNKWFVTFKQNITSWMERATPEEWAMLEGQDPSGKLKRLQFKHILKKLECK